MKQPPRQPPPMEMEKIKEMAATSRLSGEITPVRNRQTRNHNLVFGSLMVYGLGLIAFHTTAYFDASLAWDKAYYVWAKAKDCLFITTILLLYPPLKFVGTLFLFYSIIRLLWEIVTIWKNVSQNMAFGVSILFLTLVGIIVILSIKDLIAEWKRR